MKVFDSIDDQSLNNIIWYEIFFLYSHINKTYRYFSVYKR